MAEIKLTDKFVVQPELSYSAQGATNEGSYEEGFITTRRKHYKIELYFITHYG